MSDKRKIMEYSIVNDKKEGVAMDIVTNDEYIGDSRLAEWYFKSRDGYELDSFSLGYFLKDLGDFVVVKTIDLNGALDTITAFLKSDILEIRYETAYTDMLNSYIEQNMESNLYDPYHLMNQWDTFNANTIQQVLLNCFEAEKVISVCILEGEYVEHGKIVLLTDNVMTLNESEYLADLNEHENCNTTIRINKTTEINFLSKNNHLYEQYLLKKTRIK
ncbi:hypothetical protein ERK14_02260 [Lactobacillus kunkeei]|nr:hypothetical protein [Apilactobacillus kunkeei]